MLNNYTDEVNLLLQWYDRTKKIVIETESLDNLNKSFIQPLHEQRYCLDHLMRAVSYEKQSEKDELIKKSLTSAISHLQRAYSDCIEWLLLSVKDEFLNVLKPYSKEQIDIAFPEYYKEIRPSIEKITTMINDYKINKSVEKATDSELILEESTNLSNTLSEQFVSDDTFKTLKNYLQLLYEHEPLLIEVSRKDRKVYIRDRIIIPIITGIIGGLIVALLKH